MKVRVDPDLCTGCELCTETCPEVFQMGESDLAEVIVDEVPRELEDVCRQAADECPVDAILIEE